MARLPEVCNFAGALKITMDITGESVPPPEDIADHDDDAGEDDEMSEGVSMEPVPLAKISPPKDNDCGTGRYVVSCHAPNLPNWKQQDGL